MIKLCTLVLVLFGLVACTSADSKNTDICKHSTVNPALLASTLAERKNFPGMAIAIGVRDEIVWTYGYGKADVSLETPVDPLKTKFRIGSTSKSLTGFALAVLNQQQRLDLDQPVTTLLPELPPSYENTTLKQLAGHLGGVRHYEDISELGNTTEYASSREALDIFANDALVAPPGSSYSYSTYGYTVISAALEARYDTHFLNIMSDGVFEPLEMDNTVLDQSNISPPERTQFYYLDENKKLIIGDEINSSNKWAGGGFLSSAGDLARFGLAHFNDDILTQDSRDLLWTSQLTESGEKTGYGVGWFVEEDWVQHPGGALGGSTLLRIYPDQEIVVVLMANLSLREQEGFDELLGHLFACFDD